MVFCDDTNRQLQGKQQHVWHRCILFFAQKYLDNKPKNTCVSSDKLVFISYPQGELMRYFRPFEGYALFLVQKNLVNKVCHLNPPSRKNNSCMLHTPMFSQDNAKIYTQVKTNNFEIFLCIV